MLHEFTHTESSGVYRKEIGEVPMLTQTDKPVPDVDSGVMCSITVQNSSSSFDDTLVCWRHRNDCATCKTSDRNPEKERNMEREREREKRSDKVGFHC